MEEQALNLDDRLRQRIGRPSRVMSVSIRFTEEETEALTRLAKAQIKTLREWAREVLLREASKSDTDPVFTEIVATRMLLNLVLKHIACGEQLTAEMFSAVLMTVRTTKQKQAVELMQQYTSTDEKES